MEPTLITLAMPGGGAPVQAVGTAVPTDGAGTADSFWTKLNDLTTLLDNAGKEEATPDGPNAQAMQLDLLAAQVPQNLPLMPIALAVGMPAVSTGQPIGKVAASQSLIPSDVALARPIVASVATATQWDPASIDFSQFQAVSPAESAEILQQAAFADISKLVAPTQNLSLLKGKDVVRATRTGSVDFAADPVDTTANLVSSLLAKANGEAIPTASGVATSQPQSPVAIPFQVVASTPEQPLANPHPVRPDSTPAPVPSGAKAVQANGSTTLQAIAQGAVGAQAAPTNSNSMPQVEQGLAANAVTQSGVAAQNGQAQDQTSAVEKPSRPSKVDTKSASTGSTTLQANQKEDAEPLESVNAVALTPTTKKLATEDPMRDDVTEKDDKKAETAPDPTLGAMEPAKDLKIDAKSKVQVVRQVREAVADTIRDLVEARRPGQMTIRLQPEDLGSVTVTVRTLGPRVDADVTASDQGLRASLAQHRHELLASVEKRGLQMGNFTVGQENNAWDASRQAGNRQQQGQPMRNDFEQAGRLASASAPLTDPVAAAYAVSTSDSVDYKV